MGGVRNGKSAGTPEPAAAPQGPPQPGAPDVKPAEDASEAVDRQLRSALRLLREGSAARAFGELARATRTLPMSPRLAAALVRYSLLAGTEAAAITVLDAVPESAAAEVRCAVRRQLARVLRRVGQQPRAIAALEALLAECPGDRRAQRGLQLLRDREGGKGTPAEPASGASSVLGKLPTRKAGVQAPAVWEEEDSGYRVETVVEPPEGGAPAPPPPEPRERTAVAFPSLSARAPDVPWNEPGAKVRAAGPPPRESRTEIEIPALGALPDPETEALEVEPRSKGEPEPPVPDAAREAAPPAKAEAGPQVPEAGREAASVAKAEAGPQAPGTPRGPATDEPRKAEARPPVPGTPREPAADAPRRTEVALPLPWASQPEARAKTVVELPAVGGESRAKATEETTGEITSEALPFPPASAAVPPTKERPGAAPSSPMDTQELSVGDLESALRAQRSRGSARAEPSQTSDGAPRAAPGARAEDAEELARSQKLEAQLIARQAWRELAQLYLKRADRARDAAERAEALTRLAEVMENELQDPAGAARMYREIVELTGDRAALREQVRLLGVRGDASLVRRALDEAIRRARTDRARAGALLTRGERWLHMGELKKAREDFEAANALSPGLLPVLAGLFRCASEAERPAATERLRAALAAAPRRSPDRLEGLRVLAQAAEETLDDPRLAHWAWSEVLTESPDNEQAQAKLLALARGLGDSPSVAQFLRAQLAREPRGPAARQARLELVSTLEAQGDEEGALSELRQAVRFEPGHKEAWLLLVERLTARGNMGEAAWALEHAATATEDELERERTWERLARHWREVLDNPERAQVFSRRAESLRQSRAEREPPESPRTAPPQREPGIPGPPLVPPPPALSLNPKTVEGLADEVTSTTDPIAAPLEGSAPAPAAKAAPAARGEREAPTSKRGRKAAAKAGTALDSPAAQEPRAEAAPGAEVPPAPRADRHAASPGTSAAGSAPFDQGPERTTLPFGAGAAAILPAPASAGAPPRAERPPASAAAPSAPGARAERGGGPASPGAAAGAPSAQSPRAERAAPAAAGGPATAASRGERAAAEGSATSSPGAASAPSRAAPPGTPAAPVSRGERPAAPAGASAPRAERAAAPASAAAPQGAPAAQPPRAERPAASAAPTAPAPRTERPAAPAAPTSAPTAPAPRTERPAAPASGPAAPGPRAQRPGATAPSPQNAAPSSEPATPRARADKAAAAPRVSEGESSPPAARAPASGARPGARAAAPDSPRGREGAGEGEPPARSPAATDLPPDEAVNVENTRAISWEAPPGRMDPVRRIVRSRQEEPAPAAPDKGRTFIAKPPAPPVLRPGAVETRESPVVPEPSIPADTEPDAFRHIRERPLDPKPYRQLAEYFDSRGDAARASLMREIADAIEGRDSSAPRAQRPPLTVEERAGLRHPGLRTPSGELLACTGIALCRLFPAQGSAGGTLEPLRASSGPGAPAVLDALHTSARLLDVHLPELVLGENDGPPFTAVHAGNPRLLVGRLAVRQAPAAAELRFHAGRALLSLSPDLLALRTLKGGQLLRALALLTTVLKDPRASGPDARVVREALAPKALERAMALLEPGTRDFDATALVDAARDSANRAGLVACGSVGAALAALRARRSRDAELVELLRFAASERYLPLRSPR